MPCSEISRNCGGRPWRGGNVALCGEAGVFRTVGAHQVLQIPPRCFGHWQLVHTSPSTHNKTQANGLNQMLSLEVMFILLEESNTSVCMQMLRT